MHIDFTAERNGRTVRVNAVDSLAGGISPTLRERRTASRFRHLAGPVVDQAWNAHASAEDRGADLDDVYVAEKVKLERWSASHELVSVEWNGPRIEVTGFVELEASGIEVRSNCEILDGVSEWSSKRRVF